MKNNDSAYAMETDETCPKRHCYVPILGEIVEICRDQRHFLIFKLMHESTFKIRPQNDDSLDSREPFLNCKKNIIAACLAPAPGVTRAPSPQYTVELRRNARSAHMDYIPR